MRYVELWSSRSGGSTAPIRPFPESPAERRGASVRGRGSGARRAGTAADLVSRRASCRPGPRLCRSCRLVARHPHDAPVVVQAAAGVVRGDREPLARAATRHVAADLEQQDGLLPRGAAVRGPQDRAVVRAPGCWCTCPRPRGPGSGRRRHRARRGEHRGAQPGFRHRGEGRNTGARVTRPRGPAAPPTFSGALPAVLRPLRAHWPRPSTGSVGTRFPRPFGGRSRTC